MEKRHIIAEIKRVAHANGGTPPGRERFAKETGISVNDWYPHLWLRWGDALAEAGFAPNRLASKLDSAAVLEKYVALVRDLGRAPLSAELKVKARNDPTFPSHGVYDKFGGKLALLSAVREHCARIGASDVLALLPAAPAAVRSQASLTPRRASPTGFVYLMKSGRHFKIGRTNSVGRREWELGIKIPVPPTTIHYIETDDPVGVEAYWHRRFAEKRGEGEWFKLQPDDVAAFKRWKKIA